MSKLAQLHEVQYFHIGLSEVDFGALYLQET